MLQHIHFIMMKKSIVFMLMILLGLVFRAECKPKVRVVIDVGHMPDCSGTGFCGIKVTVNFLREKEMLNAWAENDGRTLIFTINKNEQPESLIRLFNSNSVFEVYENYQLSDDLISKLEIENYSEISKGRYQMQDNTDEYVLIVQLE